MGPTRGGYPSQPRPFDLVPRDVPRMSACLVTPKVNGTEAFLLIHRFGLAAIGRSRGTLITWPMAFSAEGTVLWPSLLEGELVDGRDARLFRAFRRRRLHRP